MNIDLYKMKIWPAFLLFFHLILKIFTKFANLNQYNLTTQLY